MKKSELRQMIREEIRQLTEKEIRLFDRDNIDKVIKQLETIDVPFIEVIPPKTVNDPIIIKISLDEKRDWPMGKFTASRWIYHQLFPNGKLIPGQGQRSLKGIRTTVRSIQDVINKFNYWFD